jgi:hypothetical protein
MLVFRKSEHLPVGEVSIALQILTCILIFQKRPARQEH